MVKTLFALRDRLFLRAYRAGAVPGRRRVVSAVAGGTVGVFVLSLPGVKFGRVGAVMRGVATPGVAALSVLVIIVSATVRPEIWRSGTI